MSGLLKEKHSITVVKQENQSAKHEHYTQGITEKTQKIILNAKRAVAQGFDIDKQEQEAEQMKRSGMQPPRAHEAPRARSMRLFELTCRHTHQWQSWKRLAIQPDPWGETILRGGSGHCVGFPACHQHCRASWVFREAKRR